MQVKWWITINEPSVVTWLGYGDGVHAPGVKDPLGATFKTAHNLIKSHAQAYKRYEKYRATQKGEENEHESQEASDSIMFNFISRKFILPNVIRTVAP